MGILRSRVDLAYRASSDPLKMHRALRIVKPNTDISGDYTCVVSTFMEEDSRTKQMIVFVPETNFRLIQNKTDNDTVNVICAADGAFPAPNLTLATPKSKERSNLLSGAHFTTPEMPTAADMQLAAAIGSKGASTCIGKALVLLPALAQSLLAVK
ncbi:unnamed protein product [Parnassius apollo]|uniref:(apollo) hypothetical protein n=1 Tax=Parnassius apollo TaxID=110799 RepID=A0A8S3XA44_PARAO|nr:unnamed protein product [Parnassius apollo]